MPVWSRLWAPQNLPRVDSELYPRVDYGGSQSLPLPPRIYPPLLWLCEVSSAPRICPSLPEYTPLFNNFLWPSQNLPLPPRIYPPFQQLFVTLSESTPPSQNIHPPFLVTICDPPKIYPSLPEYTPICNTYMPPFQNLPHFQQLYATLPESNPSSQKIPPAFLVTMCDLPSIYPSLPEYTALFNTYMRPSHNLPLRPRIYPFFNN